VATKAMIIVRTQPNKTKKKHKNPSLQFKIKISPFLAIGSLTNQGETN